MRCGEFRAMAESYATGELPVDTNHAVITHLERCAECRAELDARTALRQTLRRAFTSSVELAPTDQFVSAVRARIAQERAASGRLSAVAPWLGIAAVIALVVVSGWGWQRVRNDRQTSAAPQLMALAGEAAGDHRDCALNHALEEPVISLQEAARRYNPVYAGLQATVEEALPAQGGAMVLVGAHWCVLDGRHFGHVVFRRAEHVISVLLTPVERLPTEQAEVAACRASGGFEVACFSAQGHAIFVVSDLSAQENLQVARIFAPMLQAYLLSA